jgi:hypothetical protein
MRSSTPKNVTTQKVVASRGRPSSSIGGHNGVNSVDLACSIDLNRNLVLDGHETPQNTPAATTVVTSDKVPSAETIPNHGNVILQEATPVNVGSNPAAGSAEMVISIDINRKLDLEFGTAKVVTQIEQQRKFKELKEDCPSFDLGFDLKEAGKKVDEGATIEEPVIISSNDSGDSLDKIYATIDMPITPSTVQVKELQKVVLSPRNPNSVTPVPQARRVVKLGPKQKSPYENFCKKPTVTRSDAELYIKVCSYGGRTKHLLNKEKIIDYGTFFIYLRDLADSIKPDGWISNSTFEIGLLSMSEEMAKQKKFLMPLRLAVSTIFISLLDVPFSLYSDLLSIFFFLFPFS